MNEVFISYSRRDWFFTEKIIQELKRKGIDPWYDQEDIPAAVPWKSEMLLGVQCSQSFVYILSPDSAVSTPCQQELDCALRHNKRLIPIVARSPGVSPVHPAISELNWIFFRDFASGLMKLISVIESPENYNKILNNRQQFFLDVCDSEGRILKSIPLLRNEYLIGRHPLPDLNSCGAVSIPDRSRMISREHLKLSWNHSESGWRWRDLSQNGVTLFPRLRSEELLRHNTRIFLSSDFYLLFRAFDPEDKAQVLDDSPTESC